MQLEGGRQGRQIQALDEAFLGSVKPWSLFWVCPGQAGCRPPGQPEHQLGHLSPSCTCTRTQSPSRDRAAHGCSSVSPASATCLRGLASSLFSSPQKTEVCVFSQWVCEGASPTSFPSQQGKALRQGEYLLPGRG